MPSWSCATKLKRPSATSSPHSRVVRPARTRRISDLYASFMDEEAAELAGVSPILPLLAAIDSVETLPELTRMVGAFARKAVPGLVALQAEPDPGNPNRYVMFAGQGGLGLPDEEYYRLGEYAEIRTQYREHVSASFALAGIEDAEAQGSWCSILRPRLPRRIGTR